MAPEPRPAQDDEAEAGPPVLGSWRAVYWVVVAWLAVNVVGLWSLSTFGR